MSLLYSISRTGSQLFISNRLPPFFPYENELSQKLSALWFIRLIMIQWTMHPIERKNGCNAPIPDQPP